MDIPNYIYVIVALGTIQSRKIGACCPIRKNNSSSAALYNSVAGICNRCPPPPIPFKGWHYHEIKNREDSTHTLACL